MAVNFTNGIRAGLYAVTDTDLLPGDRLFTEVAAALRGGAVIVQYRDKGSTSTERLHQAEGLQALCRDAGVPLLINDDTDLALRVGAAGVHLGQDDTDLAEARRKLGDDAIIGATCHGDLSLAKKAVAASADYVAFGRFFASGTKPDAVTANTQVLTDARALGVPVVAIGGITAENGALLVRAGADCLAVVGGLFGTADTEHQARVLAGLINQHRPAAF
ncbi:MAG: thiamine phosphate synthase [Oleiphilaceae bacterium]|nr:thiamine phosphate synthase [Oleiphilaceae bacterium]